MFWLHQLRQWRRWHASTIPSSSCNSPSPTCNNIVNICLINKGGGLSEVHGQPHPRQDNTSRNNTNHLLLLFAMLLLAKRVFRGVAISFLIPGRTRRCWENGTDDSHSYRIVRPAMRVSSAAPGPEREPRNLLP